MIIIRNHHACPTGDSSVFGRAEQSPEAGRCSQTVKTNLKLELGVARKKKVETAFAFRARLHVLHCLAAVEITDLGTLGGEIFARNISCSRLSCQTTARGRLFFSPTRNSCSR